MLPQKDQKIKVTYGRSIIFGKADYPKVEGVDRHDPLGPWAHVPDVQHGIIGIFIEDGPLVDLRWDSNRGPLGWTWEADE